MPRPPQTRAEYYAEAQTLMARYHLGRVEDPSQLLLAAVAYSTLASIDPADLEPRHDPLPTGLPHPRF